MKKAIKVIAIILLVIAVLIGILIFALSRLIKSALGDQWEDYAKLFTMQTGKDLPPLENVSQRRVDIKFINKDGAVETRPIRIYLPEEAVCPCPLWVWGTASTVPRGAPSARKAQGRIWG